MHFQNKMRLTTVAFLLFSALCVQECLTANPKARVQSFKGSLSDSSKAMDDTPAFVELKRSTSTTSTSTKTEKTSVESHTKAKKSPSSLFYNLADTAVAANQKVQSYVQGVGNKLVTLTTGTNANVRALYLFLFAALTVVVCCIGLQYILNNAKESRKYLTNQEKKRKNLLMRTESQQQQQQQQQPHVQGINEASAALDAHQRKH